ncbi:ScbA/BarX family gamma-butyrolactone biosynthesis protein [Jannaschia sp. R86511]|uniref:ScbA/BarX family gamma-butyrolactone biosynthesis protein n=1 Tax=Jannaschia sp. R86511 TaxID=3093853 RepID=UPI0036D2BC9F
MTSLDSTRTLDRSLVHRWSVAEVFVTALRCEGQDRVEAVAQWPRHHAYFDTGDGNYCILLGAETFRQTAIAALHTMGVASAVDHFVMKQMRVRWVTAPQLVGVRPFDLGVTLSLTPAVRPGRFDLEVSMATAEGTVVSGSGTVIVLRPQVFEALRAGRVRPVGRMDGPPDIDCRAVGRTRARDVVLVAQGEHRWELRVDTTHATLFDHPSDHLPGMLLFEAARQAALLTSDGRQVVSIGAHFGSYLEVDEPTLVELVPQADHLSVTVRQADLVGATFQVVVGP